MTKEEGTKKLIDYCDNQIKKSGFLIFNKKIIRIERTVLFEPWERIANLKLPPQLTFQQDINNLIIDLNGITLDQKYNWSDISATAIKTEEIVVSEDTSRYDKYLLFCLNNGVVIECKLGDIDKYHGQIGHFIEQYKMAAYNTI
ncbi:MAG: hypothetical protein V4608_08020 [Bacteroidota bacterium]